ncbi:MAG: DNA-3-methyladenine glycosylase [Oscillospiraceae bacterium]|nr:DNA-3-methyladenine glycosylase [Oscillospiraceae bacterium]
MSEQHTIEPKRLGEAFYHRPCLEVAQELVGKVLVHATADGEFRLRITETEAYCGEQDTACHAHKGKTARNRVLYAKAGTAYLYLCYGVHWLMNVITGEEGEAEGVLIRACEGAEGPGKLTKKLNITGIYNETNLITSSNLWIEEDGFHSEVTTAKRVGIGYASQEDQDRLWRFVLKREKKTPKRKKKLVQKKETLS